MKKILFLFLTLITVNSFAQEETEGIKMIEDLSFDEVLAMAKAQNKPVFMDCYTTWCGPCKFLSGNIFPTKEAGDYFNEKFISVSYDMEKGEGKELAAKFDVMAYPTLLFFSPEGEIIFKQAGAPQTPEQLIGIAEKAISPDNKFVSLKKKTGTGEELNADEIMMLLNLNEVKDAQYWIRQYLNKVSDSLKFSEQTLSLLAGSTRNYTDPSFSFILEHEAAFRENLDSPERLDDLIKNVFANGFAQYQYLLTLEHPLMDNAKIQALYWIASSDYRKNPEDTVCWKAYIAAYDSLFKSGGTSNMEINNIAWVVYENFKKFNDKESLKTAKTWCEKAISEERNMYITDTYASILFELGDVKKAVEIQEEAVKLIQASNDQGYINAYEKRLEEFKKAL